MSVCVLAAYRLLRVLLPVALGFLAGASLSLALFPLIHNRSAQFIDNCGQERVGFAIAKRSHRSIWQVVKENAHKYEYEVVVHKPLLITAAPNDQQLQDADAAKGTNAKPKLVRPRFFASEVGMRDKLLLVVLCQTHEFDVAAAINKTSHAYVDKTLFFVNQLSQPQQQQAFGAEPGIDDTDKSVIHIPWSGGDALLEVLAYSVNHRLATNYDWLLLVTDSTFVHAFALQQLVSHMSIGQPLYMGTPKPHAPAVCALDTGILLSHEFLAALSNNMVACQSVLSSERLADDNLGACANAVLNLTCTQRRSDRVLHTFAAEDAGAVEAALADGGQAELNAALTVYPVRSAVHVHQLHAHYTQRTLADTQAEAEALSQHMRLSSQQQPEPEFTRWPFHIAPPRRVINRYETYQWEFTNGTHMFKNDAERNCEPMKGVDLIDMEQITHIARRHVEWQKPSLGSGQWRYSGLVSGYRMLDPQRGQEYMLDLLYESEHNYAPLYERVHVLRPLLAAEVVHEVPYVTEDTNVTVVVPVRVPNELLAARQFMLRYSRLCLQGYQENEKRVPRVVVALINRAAGEEWPSDQPSVVDDNEEDGELKKQQLQLALSDLNRDLQALADRCAGLTIFEMLNVQVQASESAQFAVMDQVITHCGPNNLFLYYSIWADLSTEFLNRVRLNTIKNYQVFMPIPFHQFHPSISGKGRDFIATLDAALNNINANKAADGGGRRADDLSNSRHNEAGGWKADNKALAEQAAAVANANADKAKQDKKNENDDLMPMSEQLGSSTIEVHKDVGRFDAADFDVSSFYGADYIRHRADSSATGAAPANLARLFVSESLHVMRAVEPQLTMHYTSANCYERINHASELDGCVAARRWNIANKAQLAAWYVAQRSHNHTMHKEVRPATAAPNQDANEEALVNANAPAAMQFKELVQNSQLRAFGFSRQVAI